MAPTTSQQQSPLYTPQHALPRVIIPTRAAAPLPEATAPSCPQCSAELMRAGDDCIACGFVARRSRVVLMMALASGAAFVAAITYGVLRAA